MVDLRGKGLLDNSEIDALDVKIKGALEEEIGYYISDYADENFAENEYMYEEIDALLEEEDVGGSVDIVDVSLQLHLRLLFVQLTPTGFCPFVVTAAYGF